MNIQGWSELDGPLDHEVFAILYDVLGSARVRGVKDLEMFWISAKGKGSEVLDLRYFAAGRKIKCRVIRATSAPSEIERLTLEVMTRIEARLAKQGILVDLAATRANLQRGFAKLARKNKAAKR